MPFTSQDLSAVIGAVCESVIAHADHLTALDRAIGDADHGSNMERGFKAVQARLEALALLAPGAAISDAGKTLVMTIGGASGPLYGTLFMRLGQELGQAENLSRQEFAAALRAAIDAVEARGKAHPGQKTMLDVLEPLYAHLSDGTPVTAESVRSVVDSAAEATIPMKAERGRASFLGERSRGHMDPGACSSALIAVAVATELLRSPATEPKPENEKR